MDHSVVDSRVYILAFECFSDSDVIGGAWIRSQCLAVECLSDIDIIGGAWFRFLEFLLLERAPFCPFAKVAFKSTARRTFSRPLGQGEAQQRKGATSW